MHEKPGTNWHKEVGSPGKEKEKIRAAFYRRLAELKNAINEDVQDLTLPQTELTEEKGNLFGVLKFAFGLKKTVKILEIASKEGSEFNVDLYEKGDTVAIESERESSFLIKRNKNGEVLEKVLISKEKPSEKPTPPTEPNKELEKPDPSRKEPETPDKKPETPQEILGKRIQKVIAKSKRIAGEDITIYAENETSIDITLVLEFDGKKEQVQIQHQEGAKPENSFINGTYTAKWQGKEFPDFGPAVKQATLMLKGEKPEEEHSHDHEHGPEEGHSHKFEVSEDLPLDEQWKEWKKEAKRLCDKEKIELETKEGVMRKTFTLRRNRKFAKIRVTRKLSRLRKGGWTNKDCVITYKGEPLKHLVEAIYHAIEEPFDKPSKQWTPPWKKKPHVHSHSEDSHH